MLRRSPLLEQTPFSKVYFSRQGDLLGIYPASDDQYRYYSHISSFPQDYLSIILLQEDRYFYFHPGMNPVSLFRAFYRTYVEKSRRIGGSTITMQLARLHHGLNTRDIGGKIRQILHAVYLDLFYSKQDILEAYLNLVPCGGNIQGFPAASLIYFDRPLGELNLDEMMMLCVLPQDPLNRNPRHEKNHSEILGARNRLYERWKSTHPDREEKIFHLDLFPAVKAAPRFRTPHLTEQLRARFPGEKTLTTSIDWDLQKGVEVRLRDHVEKAADRGVRNGAALVLDYRTMELLAMVGSVDFFSHSIEGMVNGANSRRSPGSTLKPFIYGQGLDQGLIHSDSILYDRPMSFSAYAPDNYKRDFKGPVPAWSALVNSRNIPAVELNFRLHTPDLYDLLEIAEVGGLKEKDHYGLSIVLGSAELSMLELTGLYASLGNGGKMKNILIAEGKVLKSFPERSLMTAQAARIVHRMLARNPPAQEGFPEDGGWKPLNRTMPVAYKTGTSIGFKDAWSIGFYGPYVLAVWIGNFSGEGNPAFIGRNTAAPLLFDMARLLEGRVKFFRPKFVSGVSTVDVCSVSGAIPGEYCRHVKAALFIPGVSPIKKCEVHRPFWVNEETGLRVRGERDGARMIIREVWPSDLLEMFRESGIPRPVPPPYEEAEPPGDAGKRKSRPTIISPVSQAAYILRPEKDRFGEIPLMGSADGEVNEIFWFANGVFLGRSEPKESLIWTPVPGQYNLILLDDRGLSQDREVTVLMEP